MEFDEKEAEVDIEAVDENDELEVSLETDVEGPAKSIAEPQLIRFSNPKND